MTVLLDRRGIEALIPHAGAMCLWHEMLAVDADSVRLRTDSHRDPQHPLRHAGQLRGLHLIEYGAQAAAVHGGWLVHGGVARSGVLAAARDVELRVARIDDLECAIECVAQRLVSGAGGWVYRFHLLAGAQTLASGRVSVIHTA